MLQAKKMLWVLTMAACLVWSASASADFVANPGFEDQPLAEGVPSYTIPSWNSDYAPDFTYVINPDPVNWPYAVAHSGDNVMVMGCTSAQSNYVYQNALAMSAGTTYSLSAYVSQLDGLDPGYVFLSLFNVRTGSHVASATSDPTYSATWPIEYVGVPSTSWTQLMTPAYTATGEDEGAMLRVDIWVWQRTGGDYNYAAWDDFSISAVPEPTTIGLLAVGGLLLRRRK